ncbi:MAG TPA: GNAT family protein [Pseudonocardiaceae bacterium]|nr:GNAT family protein [Pseudonocardiaceae bacterium]
MSTVAAAMFTFSLGDDAALLPRTPAIAEAYQGLLEANFARLVRWLPGLDELPTLEQTRADLARRGQAWLDGSQLPLAIAVRAEGGWRLVGEVNLLIDNHIKSAEIGYWLDADFEGRGLATRAVRAALDWAFGPLGLRRIKLFAMVGNEPSIRLAERLDFTREGIFRAAAVVGGVEHDVVGYGLLAREWSHPAG